MFGDSESMGLFPPGVRKGLRAGPDDGASPGLPPRMNLASSCSSRLDMSFIIDLR